jgi:hypothetical protein
MGAASRVEAGRRAADCCLAIGLGKAIALESGLLILAVPTTYTYAGSEMTPIYA